jgi:hypothetical protein
MYVHDFSKLTFFGLFIMKTSFEKEGKKRYFLYFYKKIIPNENYPDTY